MNAPVFAAFAPGVLVSGRIVSAISSRNATSCALNLPGGCSARELVFSTAANNSLPPTNASPPSNALTRRMASRRLINCCSVSDDSDDSFIVSSQVAAIKLVHREVRGAGGKRHVGEGGILTGAGDHARAVGDENIRRVPDLIVRIEHRGFRISSHAR